MFEANFLDKFDALLDTRTPSEFHEDHIPNAVNIPVLYDEERSFVGKLHKISSFQARCQGASLISANISAHLKSDFFTTKTLAWCPLVYCWRGGQRSGSLTEVLCRVGWRTEQLSGGYKTYRQWVIQKTIETPPQLSFLVLRGKTGVGKTKLLKHLRKMGAQVLDLESLANHMGSAFGYLGSQPSQKCFESQLCYEMQKLDLRKVTFVESESRKIGRIHVPGTLLARMRSSPVVDVTAQRRDRIENIFQEYRRKFADKENFQSSLEKIKPYLSNYLYKTWKELYLKNEIYALIGDMLDRFYDVGYDISLRKNYSLLLSQAKIDIDPCDESSIEKGANIIHLIGQKMNEGDDHK